MHNTSIFTVYYRMVARIIKLQSFYLWLYLHLYSCQSASIGRIACLYRSYDPDLSINLVVVGWGHLYQSLWCIVRNTWPVGGVYSSVSSPIMPCLNEFQLDNTGPKPESTVYYCQGQMELAAL